MSIRPDFDYTDQSAIFDPSTWSWPVHLIGAGGINNLVGPVLAKMGVRELHIWDDDRLEARNCPTEVAYSYDMTDWHKVTAMADMIYYLMGSHIHIEQHPERVTETTPLNGVVICGVDSMASRHMIWENVKEHFLDIPFFVDGRSAGELTSIFAFAPADFQAAADYETWLFDDSEALPLACGARNIGYISAYMASEIARLLTRFHRNLPVEFHTIRDFSVM